MGLTPTSLMISMIVASFVLHYFFASLTAHAVALFPIFIAFSVKFISPEQLTTFLILFSGTLGIMGIITPYGTRVHLLFGMVQDIFLKDDGGF